MAKIGKGEMGASRSRANDCGDVEGDMGRRVLRLRYHRVKNLINDEREELSSVDSEKFNSVMDEVENLHRLVKEPREQVADAEALLDIATTLVTSVRSNANGGVTPSDFITSLLRNYGQWYRVAWVDIGIAVSGVFRNVPGCRTMIGPMMTEMKQRKAVNRRKRTRPTQPTQRTRPEEVGDDATEENTDTDKNMSTMFEILKKKRCVRLENLVLNRSCFAQTVENIFALSFLVKDGRAEIDVNENQHQLVLPRNAPSASEVASGEVSYSHFVFRFDYEDWKLMLNVVQTGEELMPHRNTNDMPGNSQTAQWPCDSKEVAALVPPIKKLSKNRGLVVQEDCIVDETSGKMVALEDVKASS